MPKVIEHPRASMQRALQLAEAVDGLGGEASIESAADALGNKVSGSFRALMSAAGKFGLLTLSRGKLKLETDYQDYKLSYTDEQKRDALKKIFLNAPLFSAVARRLEGQVIPGHFEKLLIREYAVPEDDASKVAGYFVEGARMAGVIGAGGVIGLNSNATPIATLYPSSTATSTAVGNANLVDEDIVSASASANADKIQASMTVRIVGLGMDEKINIEAEEDIDILDAMVKKMRRLLKAKEATELAG